MPFISGALHQKPQLLQHLTKLRPVKAFGAGLIHPWLDLPVEDPDGILAGVPAVNAELLQNYALLSFRCVLVALSNG